MKRKDLEMEIHAKEEMHVTGDDDKELMVNSASEFWEMFLHVTSIRVLVVENDDSTRRVISALLMNCNYEG